MTSLALLLFVGQQSYLLFMAMRPRLSDLNSNSHNSAMSLGLAEWFFSTWCPLGRDMQDNFFLTCPESSLGWLGPLGHQERTPQEEEPQSTSTYQASASITPLNVPLAKASHVAQAKGDGEGAIQGCEHWEVCFTESRGNVYHIPSPT